MKTFTKICGLGLMLATLAVAGCGGGSSGYGDDDNGNGSGSQPPPAVGASGFVPFIKEQFVSTSDASEPIEINDRQWEFNEDEAAYDEVLAQQ